MRAALGRRVGRIRSLAPAGCPECRAMPPLVILWAEDPEPLASCPVCGRPITGTRRVRFAVDDRGPA